MIKFTKKEIEALEILERHVDGDTLPEVDAVDFKNRTWYKSGINCIVLRNLEKKGAVEMDFLLGGKVTDVDVIISSYAAKAAL